MITMTQIANNRDFKLNKSCGGLFMYNFDLKIGVKIALLAVFYAVIFKLLRPSNYRVIAMPVK